jgi:hypothetical protein
LFNRFLRYRDKEVVDCLLLRFRAASSLAAEIGDALARALCQIQPTIFARHSGLGFGRIRPTAARVSRPGFCANGTSLSTVPAVPAVISVALRCATSRAIAASILPSSPNCSGRGG